VQVLGDVFPGGEPVVALLLPRVVVVPPARRREGPPHKFLLEVIRVDEGILGAEEDVLDELVVAERRDVVVEEGVVLHEPRVDPARVHPLGLRHSAAPPTSSSAAEHWLGYDCVRQERRDQNENDEV